MLQPPEPLEHEDMNCKVAKRVRTAVDHALDAVVVRAMVRVLLVAHGDMVTDDKNPSGKPPLSEARK